MVSSLNVGLIKNLDHLKALVERLMADGLPIGFDVETGYHGPDTFRGALTWASAEQFVAGFSFTNDKRWARYVPVAHDMAENLPEYETWEVMKPLLETLPVICHHEKYESHNLHALEWKGRGPRIDMKFGGDTMLQGYVQQGVKRPDGKLAQFRRFGLKDMVLAAFDHEMVKIEALFPGYTKLKMDCLRFNILELTPEVVSYGCEDAAWTLALHELVEPQAKEERGKMLAIEYEISELMTELEEFGMFVAWDEMEEERRKAIPFKERMEIAVKTALGVLADRDLTPLNLGSPKQLQELIYRDLGFAATRLTSGAKDGGKSSTKEAWQQMSTDAGAMEGLAQQHPALKKLLEWREVGNALSRFDRWLDRGRTAADGRIHPSYSQVVVGTGRFAAQGPDVHQCPKVWRWTTSTQVDCYVDKGAEWKEFIGRDDTIEHLDYWHGNFRDYICATKGWTLLTFDYSQIELIVLAGLAQEPVLLEAFRDGTDVHYLTASLLLGKPIDQITKRERDDIGKRLNYALQYEAGPKRLGEEMGVSTEKAKELYDLYFAQFSAIKIWKETVRNAGEQNGYAETFFGRKWVIWDWWDEEVRNGSTKAGRAKRASAQRKFVNAPVQGAAADMLKVAMIRARRSLIKRGWWGTQVKMVHNLHDSLVFEMRNDVDANELRDLLQQAVVFPVKGWPQVVADWDLGQRHGSGVSWPMDTLAVYDAEVDGWVVGTEQLPKTPTPVAPPPTPPPAPTPTPVVVAPAPVVQAPTPEAAGPTDSGRQYKIECVSMPTLSQMQRFLHFVTGRPGANHLTLHTPEGVVPCTVSTAVDQSDQGYLSVLLGGVAVRPVVTGLNMGHLMGGLGL